MKYTVTFTYTEGGTLQVEANSQEEANQKIYDQLEASGLDDLNHTIVHREWETL